MQLPYQEVIDTLSNNIAIIRSLVDEFPLDLIKRQPAQGVWSAHEHLCHLATVHDLFFKRLEKMLSEDDPVIEPYFPDQELVEDALLRRDLDEDMQQFSQDRQRLVEKLKGLTLEQWTRTAQHEEYTRYSVFIMFRHLALHDLDHAYDVEALLLSKLD